MNARSGPDLEAEVAVVGGGPVGLGLAIELGQRGIAVALIEQSTILHQVPKGQNLTQRTMEHLRAWGVEDEVRRARLMPPGYPSVGVNSYGTLLSEHAHPWFRRSAVDPYYFATNERLPQYLTEEKLRHRVGELASVRSLFGVSVTRVAQDDDEVVVSTDRGEVRALFAVGCDGSHSKVRSEVGIGEVRSDHERLMALVVFRSTELHRLVEDRFGEAAFFNVLHPDLDGYWRFLGRVDVGETWFFHAPVPPDSTDESLDYRGLLHAAVGASFDLELEHLGFWRLRVAIADSYRKGRVFLAGDAAHSHPPYGGYGINTGFEDARNLGWKLAAVLQGWGGAGLLDSYEAERRPVFESTARDFIEAFIERDREFIGRYDPRVDEAEFARAWEERRKRSNRGVSQFEPHYEGSPIVVGTEGGRPGAGGEHQFRPRPGHHLSPPDARRSYDDLFEALGPGFTLILPTDDEGVGARFQAAAADRGVPMKVLTPETSPSVGAFDRAPILVRPDHFVSWVGDGSAVHPAEVIDRSVGS